MKKSPDYDTRWQHYSQKHFWRGMYELMKDEGCFSEDDYHRIVYDGTHEGSPHFASEVKLLFHHKGLHVEIYSFDYWLFLKRPALMRLKRRWLKLMRGNKAVLQNRRLQAIEKRWQDFMKGIRRSG